MRNGTFWPTRIDAAWLSSVVTLGVDKRFALVDCPSAWIRMPYLSSSDSPMVRPVEIATAEGTFRSRRMLPSASPLLLNEVEAKPAWGAALPKPSCTPSCSAMSPEISAIAASISTCGRRWSSWATSCAEVGLHLGPRPDHHGVDVLRRLDGDVLGGVVDDRRGEGKLPLAGAGRAARRCGGLDIGRRPEAVGDARLLHRRHVGPERIDDAAGRGRPARRSPPAAPAPSRRRRRTAADRPG